MNDKPNGKLLRDAFIEYDELNSQGERIISLEWEALSEQERERYNYAWASVWMTLHMRIGQLEHTVAQLLGRLSKESELGGQHGE